METGGHWHGGGPLPIGALAEVGLPDHLFRCSGPVPPWTPDDDASETVLDPRQARIEPVAGGPIAPLAAASKGRKWRIALAASLALHGLAAAAFLLTGSDEDALIAGGGTTEIAGLGNGAVDQLAAGDIVTVTIMPMATVSARPVEAVAVSPAARADVVDRPKAMRIGPAEHARSALAVENDRLRPVEPDRAAAVLPDRVAAAQPSDRTPAPPADTTPAPVSESEPALADAVSADEIPRLAPASNAPPVLAARSAPDSAAPSPSASVNEDANAPVVPPVTPSPRSEREAAAKAPSEPAVVRPVANAPPPPSAESSGPRAAEAKGKTAGAKPRRVITEKGKAKKSQAKSTKAGSSGANETDAARGDSSGRKGGTAASSAPAGRSTAAGNAAVSNYPGKVAAKLRRALRYPPAARSGRLKGEARVRFVLAASGAVSSISLVTSSGSPILDRAALEAVGRAAPFPPFPAGSGRSSWPFTVPLSFSRR